MNLNVRESLKQIWPLLVLIAVTVWGQQTWLSLDQRYQYSDMGSYMEVSQEAYMVGRVHGLLEEVRFAYFHRHWKPIVEASVHIPFLHLTGGDVRLAFKIYAFLLLILTASGFYAAALQISRSRWLSVCVAGILLFTGWAMGNLLIAAAEGPWVCAAAWYLFFIYRSDFLRKPRPALFAVLSLIVVAWSRPAEATVLLFPPFLYFLTANTPKGSARKSFLILTICEIAVAAGIAARPFLMLNREYSYGSVLMILASVIVYAAVKTALLRRPRFKDFRQPANLITLTITACLIWFLPALNELVDWVHACSFGRLIPVASNLKRLPLFFPRLFIESAGAIVFVTWLTAALTPQLIRKIPRRVWLFHIWVGFFLPVFGWFTSSRDFRYYQISLVAITMLGLFATQNRKAQKLVLAVALVFQAGATLPRLFGDEFQYPEWLLTVSGWERIRLPVLGDSFPRMIARAKTLPVPSDAYIEIIECDAFFRMGPETDQWALTTAIREAGTNMQFGEYYDQHIDDEAEMLKNASERSHVLLVSPDCDSEENFLQSERRLIRALHRCVKTGCEKYDLEYLGVQKYDATPDLPEQDFLLFKRKSSHIEVGDLPCYSRFKTNYVNKSNF